jgi:hypothetical protein
MTDNFHFFFVSKCADLTNSLRSTFISIRYGKRRLILVTEIMQNIYRLLLYHSFIPRRHVEIKK